MAAASAATSTAVATTTAATSAAVATTTAATSATTVAATAASTTAAILRIRTGCAANGVRHEHRRRRQHNTDSQSQQAFLEHDEPPLGVAQVALRIL
ncbi:hypothetical protein D3C81_1127500 [compost metagenome]